MCKHYASISVWSFRACTNFFATEIKLKATGLETWNLKLETKIYVLQKFITYDHINISCSC